MAQPTDSARPDLAFERMAEIAVGATARIELSRVISGAHQGELVVVKRLHPHIADEPQFVDMFRDEAWMTASLKHQHVVQVVGWGTDPQGPFLAVEFVRGVSLARLMKTVFETGERFTERMVVYLGACVCAGLDAAHGLCGPDGEHLSLVHRDITPGNVLLGFDGQVKIADFGLAKAKLRMTKTLTGLLKGQPHYMAPEQIRSEPLDGRTDVFALGVLLYELFAGRRPWDAASDLDAMRATIENDPAPLQEQRPKIDKALVKVVNRCLEKDPAARFQSADELREAFQKWLNAHGYRDDNELALARFVRRNAMRQMRWFDRAMAGHFAKRGDGKDLGTGAMGPGQGPPAPGRPASDDGGAPTRITADAQQRIGPAAALAAQGPPLADGEPSGEPLSDWGEEGPTLIQSSGKAKSMLRRITEGLRTLGRSRPPPRPRLPTAPTRQGVMAPGYATLSLEDDARGSFAPPPPSAGLGADGAVVAPASAQAVAPAPASMGDDGRGSIPPPPAGLGADGAVVAPASALAVAAAVTDDHTSPEATTIRRQASAIRGSHGTPGQPGTSVRPPGVVAPPDPNAPPLPPAPIESLRPTPSWDVSGASVGPLSTAAPGSRQWIGDVEGEAQRLTRQASRAAEAARGAAKAAEAAARAAALAGEAVVLATTGQQSEALERLTEARRIDASLPDAVTLGSPALGWVPAPLRRWHQAFVRLMTREAAALVGVLVIVLLLVLLFWALLSR